MIKRDQDILVDYDRFIHILINLFHSLSTGSLTAVFNDNVLKFIENGEFRNICKLELKFTKPEEVQYRRYLGDLLARLENDNVKLIKENSQLRDKCVNGDRELREKIRYLESECTELRRKLEMLASENANIDSRNRDREEEISRMTSKIFGLENENVQLQYEIEKYRKDNALSYKEQLQTQERDCEELKKEVGTANEIIKKLREENVELKRQQRQQQDIREQSEQSVIEMSSKYQSVNKKYKALEEKYKNLKDEFKEVQNKKCELDGLNKGLMKRLENAQNVYNHFYSKKIEDNNLDNYSDTFSLKPESPPPR